MSHEPDGVGAEIEELIQRGGQGATELARSRALRRTQQLREAARESERGARMAQARLDVERHAARALLATTAEEGWWERASAEEIVQVWDVASEWREHEPIAERRALEIRAEMIERFGVDPEMAGQGAGNEAETNTGERAGHEVAASEESDTDHQPSNDVSASEETDTGYYGSHDVTPREVASWGSEGESANVVGDLGGEIETALRELRESRSAAAAANQTTVAETVRNGGPRRAPRVRRWRGRLGLGAERERGR